MKIIIKVLPTTVKNELPFLFFSNQTVYVKNRGISQSGRVISDILEKLFLLLVTASYCKFLKNWDLV